jgi:hypothetical protein
MLHVAPLAREQGGGAHLSLSFVGFVLSAMIPGQASGLRGAPSIPPARGDQPN